MYNLIDKYFIFWSFFIPATTLTISSQIPGSLVSYVFAVVSPLVVFLGTKKFRVNYYILLIVMISIFGGLICISQLLNDINNLTLQGLILLSNESLTEKVFRTSLITQSMYLIMGFLMFIYSKFFYNEKWDKWIVYSGVFFAAYGLYEFILFLVLGINGDFLSNRNYTQIGGAPLIAQDFVLSGITIKRIDSLSMEPSMFAFTLLPYVIFSYYKCKKKVSIFLGIVILLSTSTTAYLGVLIIIIYNFFCNKNILKNKKILISTLFIVGITYVVLYKYMYNVIEIMIINKLMPIVDFDGSVNLAGAGSGMERLFNIFNSIDYWCSLDIMHMLFGIGFGVHRSTDLFGTFLVNIGIVGSIIFFIINFRYFKIKNKRKLDNMNNLIILTMFIIMMVSVPEYSFLSYWLFLGIVYNINSEVNKNYK